jgi:glycosyltransferase involved in cell wall biosynthesis
MEGPLMNPRIVLAHDWLTGMRGGEKCLEVVARRWPESTLFTLLHKPGSVSSAIEQLPRRTSWLNFLPGIHRYYRYLLPLMPAAISGWSVPACDLLLSFSHCVVKGLRPPRGVPHVCYCFTPMRYAWHMRESYFGGRVAGLKARLLARLLEYLRDWDRRTAAHVSHFIAISKTVQQRIAECYDRESVVIYPPVDTDFYCPAPVPREEFYLAVSAFAPYKRLDLALEACARRKKRLIVIGSGQDEARLRKSAQSGIEFLGWQSDEVIRDHMRRCRALLFPGEEDFGIVPVESMACGTPVVAFGKGGAAETVIPPDGDSDPTGWWFAEQTAECLADCLHEFEHRASELSPAAARLQALRFSGQRYQQELFAFLDGVMSTSKVSASHAA